MDDPFFTPEPSLPSTPPPLDAISTLHLWRTIGPRILLDDRKASAAAAELIRGAIGNAHFSVPKMADAITALLCGDLSLLLPIIAAMPESPAENRGAIFDLRMTIILAGVLLSQHRWSSRIEHPLARGMLAQGLAEWAESIAPRSPDVLKIPKHLRNARQREEIAQWRRDRRHAQHLSLEWAARDQFRDAVALAEQDQSANESLSAVLGRARQKLDEIEIATVPDNSPTSPPADVASVVVMPVPLDIRTSMPREKRDEITYWNKLASPLPLKGSHITPDSIHENLTAEFPWMNAAIDRIFDDLRLHHLRAGPRWFKFRPMLLVGQPGIGKSRFARRVSELVGLSLRTINLGGSTDARDITGTSRGWGTATPSAIVRTLREAEMGNPLVLVDEVEKASESRHNGRVIDVLLTLLEPEGARHWYDECLCRNFDLRHVNWLLAANSADNLPAPLLSRLAVIKIGKPPSTAFPSILAGILADLSQELGIGVNDLPQLFPESAAYLERRFRNGTSIRVLQSSVRRALAATLSPSSSRH